MQTPCALTPRAGKMLLVTSEEEELLFRSYQIPPSMGFSRQEYWSGLPLPSPGDLPNPRIEPGSPAL